MKCCTPGCVKFLRWFILVAVFIAIILSCLAAASCSFIDYTHEAESGAVSSGSAGMYRMRGESGGCTSYDRSFDSSEEFARDAALVAPVMAFIALLLILIKVKWAKCKGSRLFVGLFLVMSVISQGITFAFFNSDEFCDGDILNDIINHKPCTVGKGAQFSIVALLLYFFSAVSFWCIPKSDKKEKELEESPADTSTPTDVEMTMT